MNFRYPVTAIFQFDLSRAFFIDPPGFAMMLIEPVTLCPTFDFSHRLNIDDFAQSFKGDFKQRHGSLFMIDLQ